MQVPLFKPGDIRFKPELAGGASMDLGAYTTHQVRTLAGEEPTVLSARAKQRPAGIDRWMRAELAFPSGAVGRTTVSLYGAIPLRLGFRVQGTRGELKVMNPTQPSLFSRFAVTIDGQRHREHFAKSSTYDHQLEAFVSAVLDGGPVLTPPSDSVATMDVIDAIYRAAGMSVRG